MTSFDAFSGITDPQQLVEATREYLDKVFPSIPPDDLARIIDLAKQLFRESLSSTLIQADLNVEESGRRIIAAIAIHGLAKQLVQTHHARGT